MKKIDFTNEIPEIGGLIKISEQIEQMENFLFFANQAKNKIVTIVLEKLTDYEQRNHVWLGDTIQVTYQKRNFLIKGLNDDVSESVSVSPIDFTLVINNKQSKGTGGEKEKS